MTRNMFRALPGLIGTGFFFVALILQTTSTGTIIASLLCLVACCYSMVALGSEADYWEARYRTRNWGKGDSRFLIGENK